MGLASSTQKGDDSLNTNDIQKEVFPNLSNADLEKKAKADPCELALGDWKRILTPEQFNVTRLNGTEQAFTSDLNKVNEPGTFLCVSCDNNLFDVESKFDSGTGWPSFHSPVSKTTAVATDTDYNIGVARTEVHCARCTAHLGHVFKDGPCPTGLRYCINGVSLKFQN